MEYGKPKERGSKQIKKCEKRKGKNDKSKREGNVSRGKGENRI